MSLADTVPAIEYAAELVAQAHYAVIITGAGISTPSGIPDFRSEGSGLWSRSEPMEVASLTTFRTHPERFFNWFRPLVGHIFSAEPNAAHFALSELEKSGHLQGIITQNIDMLHQKAGSQNVIETHGTLATLSCTHCYRQYGFEAYLPPYIEYGDLPYCSACNHILKPDVILFGEQLPQKAWANAQRMLRACDVLIVAGSSLEVLPVASLPMQAIDRGAHLIIINQTATYLNVRADVVLSEDAAWMLPAIVEKVVRHERT